MDPAHRESRWGANLRRRCDSSVRAHTLCLALVLGVACGRDSSSPSVEVAEVEVRLAKDSLAVGDRTHAVATVRDQEGHELQGHSVNWVSSVPGVASVDKDGTVSAVGGGETRIIGTSGGKSGSAALRVPMPVAFVTVEIFPPTFRAVGQTSAARAYLLDRNGWPVTGRNITWESSDSTVATVSPTGLVTTRAPGSTRIRAISEGISGEAPVVVVPAISIADSDSLLAPGSQFRLKGTGLANARVLIAGVAVTILSASDSVAIVSVPAALWEPCRGPNTNLELTVFRVGLDSISQPWRAAERPLIVSLAVGAYRQLPDAAGGPCRVHLSDSGSYLAVAFTGERRYGQTATADDSMALTVGVEGPHTASRPFAASTTRLHRSGIRPADRVPSDVVLAPQTGLAASCPVPEVGRTIRARTRRNAKGEISSLGVYDETEDWSVVARGKSIVVAMDSGTMRLARSSTRWMESVDAMIAFSDTGVVPFLNDYTRGIPDQDGSGNLIVYVSGTTTISGQAHVKSNARADCLAPYPPGEAIFLSWSHPFRAPEYNMMPVVHEMAHVADLGWDTSLGSRWTFEGFATFMGNLYPVRTLPNPMTVNLARHPTFLDGSQLFCLGSLGRAFEFAPSGDDWAYVLGCNFVSYLIQRRHRRSGLGLKDAIVAWSDSTGVRTTTDATRYIGEDGDSLQAYAEWLLSLYADDRQPGVALELQNTMWHSPQLWSNDLALFPFDPLPLIRLTKTAPTSAFMLGAPDAHYVEFTAGAGELLAVNVVPRRPGNAPGIVVLRRQ